MTSVVRQWLTNDYRAGVFTGAVNYWLLLLEQGAGCSSAGRCPSNLRQVLAPWLVVPRDLPGVVRQLTVGQSATFVNAEG